MMANTVESADIVVIGADPSNTEADELQPGGWAGLPVAKTYLELHQDAKVIVLDAQSSLGGVWAEERLYPGLMSNNMVGTYEYSDFPMDEETWGVKPGDHIPGQTVHDYLKKYAEKFGVLPHIRLNSKVESVQRGEKGGWLLDVGDQKDQIFARKLVLATGMTSEAFIPKIEGEESFEVPLFHIKDFPKHASTMDTVKSVTILGSTKAAWDAVYAYGSKGIEVNWIVRESGRGPCWMSPPYVTPLKKWLEKLVHTRFLTWFSPCIWGEADGFTSVRRFLHGTAVGRFFVDRFWAILGGDVITLNKYDSNPETAKLKPWIAAFWVASGLSILNYETNFFELAKSDNVKIRVADISRLSKGTVHLSSGESFNTGALVLSTGWKHTSSIDFAPAGLEARLGLPRSISGDADGTKDSLIARADDEILSTFPRLKNQPAERKNAKPLASTDDEVPEEKLSAMNLYRFMVPADGELLEARDIAFAGHLMSITTSIIAQTQALWISAYFDGKISPLEGRAAASGQTTQSAPNPDHQIASAQYSAALHNRYGKWRYPGGWRGKIPDFIFDALPYVDLLLGDLGLKTRRKGGFLKEISDPYGPEDYVGIVDEWIKGQKE